MSFSAHHHLEMSTTATLSGVQWTDAIFQREVGFYLHRRAEYITYKKDYVRKYVCCLIYFLYQIVESMVT